MTLKNPCSRKADVQKEETLIRICDYQDAAMPCGDCCVCGEELDHSEAGFCGTCAMNFQ